MKEYKRISNVHLNIGEKRAEIRKRLQIKSITSETEEILENVEGLLKKSRKLTEAESSNKLSLKKKEKTKEESAIDIAHWLRRNIIARPFADAAFKAIILSYVLLTKEGRRTLRDPELRRWLYDREAQVGMLEDSIIAPELYFPNSDETSLEYKKAVAGRWVAYDFNRAKEFGDKVKKRRSQVGEGKLVSFPIFEVLDNNPSQYTPTRLFHLLRFEHFMQADFSSDISSLLEYGLAEETTYRQAYSRVGQLDKYRTNLTLANVIDEKIYRITPKGNSLVFIQQDFGDKQKDPKEKTVLKPAFGLPNIG